MIKYIVRILTYIIYVIYKFRDRWVVIVLVFQILVSLKNFQNKKLEGKSPMLFARTVTKLKAYVRQKEKPTNTMSFERWGVTRD